MNRKLTQVFLSVAAFSFFLTTPEALAETASLSYSGPCVDLSRDLLPGYGSSASASYREEVKSLQSFLIAAGFMRSTITVVKSTDPLGTTLQPSSTGYYGPLTQEGLATFQRRYNLAPQESRSGAATAVTRAKIKELTCNGVVQAPSAALSAPAVAFLADPSSIIVGQAVKLTWSSSNAADCLASDGWSGNRSSSGSEIIQPRQSSTYTLTCSGTGGSAKASASVNVSVGDPGSMRVNINANGSDGPVTLSSGDNLKIYWYATKVKSCSLSPNVSVGEGVSVSQVTPTGTVILTPGSFNYPTTSQAYTFECRSGQQVAADSVIVNISRDDKLPRRSTNFLAATLETIGKFLFRLQDLILIR